MSHPVVDCRLFAGLLPEGFRLSQLIKDVKTSPDDELSLLLAVGQDTPVLVSMEGTNSYGSGLREALESNDFRVVEAPHLLIRGKKHTAKSDPLDAVSIATRTLPLPMN